MTTRLSTRQQGNALAAAGVLLMVALIAWRVVFAGGGIARAASTAPLLPGETLWSGVPSYDFGSNDAYDWAGNAGFDGNASIQTQVRNAHVPLIRAWFPECPNFGANCSNPFSDAHQLAIARAVTGTGAACMANLTQPNSVSYDLHLVQILAPYCRYFEIGNEPDYSGMNPMSVSAYLALWNTLVPQARTLDPGAAFGGPALATEFGLSSSTYMQQVLQGMAASGVIPDFVTFHWYICGSVSQSACLADTAQWAPGHGKTIAAWTVQYFGHAIPVGITEWNESPAPGGAMNNDAFMAQFMAAALAGFEQNPYISFLTQYDIASYACYGSCDLFNTLGGIGSAPPGAARPEFQTLANEIARVRAGGVISGPTPTQVPPTPTTPPAPTPTTPSATPSATPTACVGDGCGSSTPTPSPTPTGGVPCIEWINGIETHGVCYGTFTPTAATATATPSAGARP